MNFLSFVSNQFVPRAKSVRRASFIFKQLMVVGIVPH